MKTVELHTRMCIAFQPYRKDWEDWKLSDYCFLQYREIVATELFLRTGSIKEVACSLRRSESTAKQRVQHSLIRLESSLSVFEKWKQIRKSDFENNYLLFPVKGLPVSVGLRNRLCSLGETLEEILNKHDYNSIRLTRGVGHVKMNEFLQLLDSYGLLNSLRGLEFEYKDHLLHINA